jgi:ribosomal protein L11 methyltransferase
VDWVEITVRTTTEGADIAAQVFYEIGVTGVAIEDPEAVRQAQQEDRTWDYIDDSILSNMEEDVQVKAYISNDAGFFDKLQYIKEQFKRLLDHDFGLDMGPLDVTLTNVREEDWANNWKKYYKPIKVSDRIVIKPTWEPYEKSPGEVILELDPGMAFGTGTHETTILCIKAIDKYIEPGQTIVDIGCGTGILAIASVLLGGRQAIAIDLDSNAVKAAQENVKLNRVEDRVKVVHGNLLDKIEGQFDLVVANIIADVIIGLTESVLDFIKPGGVFISSGIILDRLDDVLEAVESAGLEIVERQTMGEWAVVVCRRNA